MCKKIVKGLVCAILCGIATAQAAPRADADMAPADKALNQLYWSGHEALKKSDWNTAMERFSRLEKELKNKEPGNVDAALYWQAYAQVKARHEDAARRLVERLHQEFPQSRWSADADELLERNARPVVAGADMVDADEDLVETAIEGLMSAPPQRAIPILKKVLQGKHSDKIKKRALFVLSQIDEDAALDLVVDVAKGSGDEELRSEAIRMLGISGEDRALVRLSEIYRAARSNQEKKDVLQAWLIADRTDLILASARDETDAEVRMAAIQALGTLDASAELQQLGKTTKDPELQRAIVQSLGVAGATAALAEIAESDQSEVARTAALQALGVDGSDKATAELQRIYPKLNTAGLRDAALQGLMIAGDSKGMIKLYKGANSKEEKQAILRLLSVMDDDSVLDLIEEQIK